MDNNTDLEYPYDSYLEVTLAEIKKRLAKLRLEDEEGMIGQHPYWIMSGMLAKKEGLNDKQASDYVYDYCARKAPEEIEGHSRAISIDPPDMAGTRIPWWCFWKR